MRIALVHPHSWPEVRRGGERYLADLAWYLLSRGHEVDVLTGTSGRASTTRTGALVERKLRHRTPAVAARRGLTDDESFGLVVLPRLVRRRWDVVHAFTPSAALAARAARIPTVYTILGHPEAAHAARHPGLARLFRTAVRHSTAPVALSEASSTAARALFGRPVGVLPPGTRLDRFPPNLDPRVGPPRVLFSAHSGDRRKRVHDALMALGHLLDRRPDARLLLSGAGDHTWATAQLGPGAERILAATDVLGVGDLDDVPGRYRAATVTVLPSEAEAFGLAVVESLASGTPVVCCDVGGPPELVRSSAVGRVVPLGDTTALAAALDQVIDLAAAPDTPATCVAHAEPWGWEAVGARHEELYRSIATR